MRTVCDASKTQSEFMAERIDNLTRRAGRPALYPWVEWMDGSAWRISQGKDFTVSPESMAQNIRERGRRYGIEVTAYPDGAAVEFQFKTKAAA